MKRILAAASIAALVAVPAAAQEEGQLAGTLFTIGETAIPTAAVLVGGVMLGGALLIAAGDDDSSTSSTPAVSE